ncbi:hypothetical protein [Sphingomonas sp.]|uniref:PGN_0703 family putative restriction endonuclease n=1 Tax=Sphingomonas sp. TaxID=28214 RepID=UPI0017CC7E05|nr:hypothetical protein [Sphingomonas sp.]MBA3510458.1 hypothetical protein [Sphingomonas sp.]
MSLRSEMILDAKWIMHDGFLRTNANGELDSKGYATSWENNLLREIDPRRVEVDLRGKGGSELEGKFRAAHSSAALAVNAFGYFIDATERLPIPGFAELQFDGFEKLFPTGVGRKPPHLDALAHNDETVVAIESKCLEYFTPKTAKFARDYFEKIVDERRNGPWFAEMVRLSEQPCTYTCLDAAQLIKHAFGLALTVPTAVTLLYVFWEPDDAHYHSMFADHRAEIADFASRVAGGRPAFQALSHQELWAHWATLGSASLQAHVDRLQLRYGGILNSYEGYSRVNGRKTDEGFWGDFD